MSMDQQMSDIEDSEQQREEETKIVIDDENVEITDRSIQSDKDTLRQRISQIPTGGKQEIHMYKQDNLPVENSIPQVLKPGEQLVPYNPQT